jgi:hypothetical protein
MATSLEMRQAGPRKFLTPTELSVISSYDFCAFDLKSKLVTELFVMLTRVPRSLEHRVGQDLP